MGSRCESWTSIIFPLASSNSLSCSIPESQPTALNYAMLVLKGATAHWIFLVLFMLYGRGQAGFVIDQASCTGQNIAAMLQEVSQQAGLVNQATSGSFNSQLNAQDEILVSNTFDSFFGSQMTHDSSGNSQQAGQEQRAQDLISEWLPQALTQIITLHRSYTAKSFNNNDQRTRRDNIL